MKVSFPRLLLVVGCILILAAVGCIGTEASPEQRSASLTVDEWVGHDFLFLALPADKQSEGYEIFLEEQALRGFEQDRSLRLPYTEHFAKQVTITRVVATRDTKFDYIVYMTEKQTGLKLAGRTVRGQLEGLALLEDRENARKRFVGKTIFANRRTLETVYEPSVLAMPVSVIVPLGAPMTVIDIWDGMQSSEPIWLVVIVNGQKAALPIAYSWTNQPTNMWAQCQPWQLALFIEDPHKQVGGAAIWNLIEAGAVEEGMSKDQVRLSWGSPNRIDEDIVNGTSWSLWTYGNKRLKFKGDILSAIENVGK